MTGYLIRFALVSAFTVLAWQPFDGQNIETSSKEASKYLELNNVGAQLYKAGKWEDAVALFDRSISLNPDFPVSHGNRGAALYKLGRFQEAAISYARAVELKPEDLYYRNYLGLINIEIGRYNLAVDALKKAIDIDPKVAGTHYNLGCALNLTGEWKQAVLSLEAAIRLAPENAVYRSEIAFSYVQLSKFELAIEELEAAIHIAPTFNEARLFLARVHLHRGNRNAALAQYKWLKENDSAVAAVLFAEISKGRVVHSSTITNQ